MSELSTDTFYGGMLLLLLALTILLAWAARPSTSDAFPAGFSSFMCRYICVWTLATLSDWMQGPYLYDLYDSYDYSHETIERLLVAGFASSGVFGCFIGAVVDRCGRRASCMMYCILYMLSCLSVHFRSVPILVVGRVLGGLATSLLFSSFECWMISEHVQRNGFSESLLGYMFSVMYFVMYCMGIASGLLGEVVTGISSFGAWSDDHQFHTGGAICAFDLAIVCLTFALALVMLLFDENYGSRPGGGATFGALHGRLAVVSLLGVVVSVFEASMFVFVSEWFRCVTRFDFQPKIGLLFSMFMMACLCGSSASTLLGGRLGPPQRLAAAFLAAFLAFGASAVAVTLPEDSVAGAVGLFAAFLTFEFFVGIYFPSVGVLKSDIVPEEVRGTIYNLYRLPLNIIIVVMLLSGFASVVKFRILSLLMLVGFCSVVGIIRLRAADGSRELSVKLQHGAATQLAERA